MSGGHWDYIQYRFTDVAEDIKAIIEKSGKEKSVEELKEEFWKDSEWYDKYPQDKYHHQYSDAVLAEFKRGADIIAKAQIYMQRIDWLLSGDDGEDSFLRRLADELKDFDAKDAAKDELIQLLTNQVMDLTMMSKIELGDDVIAEIKRLRAIITNE
jgi:hypothetical protein